MPCLGPRPRLHGSKDAPRRIEGMTPICSETPAADGAARRRGRVTAAALGLLAVALTLAPVASAHGGHEHEAVSGLGAWRPELPILAAATVALLLFAQAFVRLRRRGRPDHAPAWRALLFFLGVSFGTLALVSPLDGIGESYLLSGHMLQHVLIGDAVPALVLVALRGPLVFFLLPGFALRRLARLAPLRACLGFLLRPQVSFAFWAASLASWHLPAAYGYALENRTVHDLEHACFFLGGTLVWAQLVDPARRDALRRAGRLGLVVGMLAVGTALSNVLVLAPDPIYVAYAEQPERRLGLTPSADQQVAGLVMMAEQALALGTYCVFLLRGYLRAPAPAPLAADRHPLAL